VATAVPAGTVTVADTAGIVIVAARAGGAAGIADVAETVGAAATAGPGAEADVRRALVSLAVAAIVAALPGELASAPQAGSTVTVRASRRGFTPSSLSLRRGETARVVLSSADGEHCFAIDELRIEKRIVPGRETRFDLTPDRSGTFAFHCCLESGEAAQAERGQLTVSE
jgi:cytochrome c oxidase subunit 2